MNNIDYLKCYCKSEIELLVIDYKLSTSVQSESIRRDIHRIVNLAALSVGFDFADELMQYVRVNVGV